MTIRISTGQCAFWGASRREHEERQAIYEQRLAGYVRSAYRRHEVKIESRRDDGPLKVSLASEPVRSEEAFAKHAAREERIAEHVRELSGKAWEVACKTRLYRIAGHGGMGREVHALYTSAVDAVRRAKLELGRGARPEGVATTFADGQIGVYLTRTSMRSDRTGEHARYTIRDVAGER